MPDKPDLKQIDKDLRLLAESYCAPIWWESGRQTIVNNGSMCLVKTGERILGITNHHVLKTYERHKAEKTDIFCQLASGPFDPTAT